MKKITQKILKFTLITLFIFTLTLSWTPQSIGQLSLFTTSNENAPTQSAPWDLNEAYTCGRLWCSNVYIYDMNKSIQIELLTPELTLATLKEFDRQSNIEVAQILETRAKVVQHTFEQIIKTIINYQTSLAKSAIFNISIWHFWIPTSFTKSWNPTYSHPYHPWVPKVEVGIKNQQTVIYVPDQPQLGIPSQSIATVTIIDAKANSKTVEELAEKWKNTIQLSFSNALWGYEFDQQYPGGRLLISGVITLIILGLISVVELFRYFLRKWQRHLQKKLNQITKLLTSKKNIDLQRQTLIKQKKNFCQLFLSITFILEILLFVIALVVITLTFRKSRFFSVYFLQEILYLVFFWVILILINKLVNFAVDFFLSCWAKEAQINRPNSNRYSIRLNIYSTTLKQSLGFITILLGIYGSIWILGFNPTVLVSAGIVTVAFAFLSRNLLEDMVNGILILYMDRYSIGDVIDLGNGIGGSVENLNLFMTHLRNLKGELISIHNRKVSTVRNMTKDWSRVDFTIKIAWNEDIQQAIEIMVEIANQMQREPEWKDKFLEPLEVLGVDDISYEGVLIHLIIKTQPMEQWGLAREFRLRVKNRFDEAGISLATSHQNISIIREKRDFLES